MRENNHAPSRRTLWLASAPASALVCAALRKWQLSSAFEESGLATRFAPASVILTCVLLMSAAWFLTLALRADHGPNRRWDAAILDTGDLVYPVLMIAGAVLALAAAPLLTSSGLGQWKLYQAARAARAQGIDAQLPTNNGVLAFATAAGALLSALGLLQLGRDALHAGRRGRGGYAALIPGVAGCVWLMESFRAHAADPVRWDYAPLLLAIVGGMLLYLDLAGVAVGAARPRRLLWLAAMALPLSAAALVSAAAGRAWADVLLLCAQMLAAAGVLWRLSVEPAPKRAGAPRPSGESTIEEESTDE